MVGIKICGLSTAETMAAALAAGADLVGLVFFGKSPRNVTLDQAQDLAAQARGRAQIVALVVNADDETLTQIVTAVRPDFIQAHGHETPERITAIKKLTGLPLIKAISVSDRADVAASEPYRPIADLILFDAKPPKDRADALPGGNGLTFDWSILPRDYGFMLSGGLNPDNVAAAVQNTGATFVDVSSGVESAPGIKDCALIRKFIEAARSAR